MLIYFCDFGPLKDHIFEYWKLFVICLQTDFIEHDAIEVMRHGLFGLKKFILKDDLNYGASIPKAQSKMKK